MKKIYLILTIAFISIFISSDILFSQIFVETKVINDSLPPSVIDVRPSTMEIERPEGRFIIKTVKVLNRGGQPLIIKSIKASCACATNKIFNSTVYPLAVGKIELSVNLDGVDEEHNIVEYTIISNASNSPTKITITVTSSDKEKDEQ